MRAAGDAGIRSSNSDIVIKTDTLQFIDEFALYIALEMTETYLRILRFQFFKKIFEGLTSIYAGFPLSQEVEIRPIDDRNFF